MPRTTEDLVWAVNTELDQDIDITIPISVANSLVTELCTSSGYDDQRLTDIETYLAAHFASVNDTRTTAEQIGGTGGGGGLRVQYEGKTDLGLRFTRFGQTAILIDTAGNLAALDNRNKTIKNVRPGTKWLGTVDQTEE